MLEEIFGQAVSLCRSQEWGISEGCNGIEGVEALWCGGDPVWASEDVENPALRFVPCPQPELVLWIPEEQLYEGKNQERGTRSQWGPYINIYLHLQAGSVQERPITWK